MAQSANVRSLETLKEFRTALIKYIDKAKRSISTADSEVTRAQIWLQSTQPLHWKHEIRRAEERLAQAKSELFRATISQPDNPRGPTDQIRLVKKRQAEIKFAEVKLDKTKRSARHLEHEINEYRGAMAPLSTSLEGDMNKAVSILERSIKSLEAYIATPSTSAQEMLHNTLALDSIARKGEDKKEQQDEHANGDSPADESN
tara:strand:+ start:671 stop:1276 length:606 start_codon:yes stop_codon:yes gene_type:complete